MDASQNSTWWFLWCWWLLLLWLLLRWLLLLGCLLSSLHSHEQFVVVIQLIRWWCQLFLGVFSLVGPPLSVMVHARNAQS